MKKKRTLLSTYTIRVYDDTSTVCQLDNFDGSTDFYDFLKKFVLEVYQNVKKGATDKDNATLHLTFDELPIHDDTTRTIYGFLSSGVGGDEFTVREQGTNISKYKSDPNSDVTFRDLFLYIQIPRDKDYGYVIIQKKRELGAKNLLNTAITAYLNEQERLRYKSQIYNALDGRVYQKMISEGNLKKINFIKRSLPSTMEELYDSTSENTSKGVLTTTLQAHGGLSEYWKSFVDGIYNKIKKNDKIELDGVGEKIDEMEFQLEYNGKIKTFHVRNTQRTLPDIDVTTDLTHDENGKPTVDSLLDVSNNLVKDFLSLKPMHASQN